MQSITFSIIMPAYNAAVTIEEALQSIIEQIGCADEVIVIDDKSTDDTISVVSSFNDPRIKLLSHDVNQGISAARNTGLRHVQKDYVAFIDADDCWPSDRQEIVIPLLQLHQPEILAGAVEHFYCPSLNAEQVAKYECPNIQYVVSPCSTVIKRTLFNQAGYFDESLRVGEFADLVSRIKAYNPQWIKTDKVLFRRRIHGKNHSLLHKSKQIDFLRVVRNHINRKNQAREQR